MQCVGCSGLRTAVFNGGLLTGLFGFFQRLNFLCGLVFCGKAGVPFDVTELVTAGFTLGYFNLVFKGGAVGARLCKNNK